MKHGTRLFASTALVALIGLPAAAQQTLGTNDAIGGQTGTQAGLAEGQVYHDQAGAMTRLRASNLIGMEVYRSDTDVGASIQGAQTDWEQLGSVSDVILTPQGDVQAVIVDMGGFLGMGSQEIGVDMRELRFVADDATAEDLSDFFLVMNVPRDSFDQAQAYDDTGFVYGQQGVGGTTESATMQNDPGMVPDNGMPGEDSATLNQPDTGMQAGDDQLARQDDATLVPDAATGATQQPTDDSLRDTAAVTETDDLTGTQANISPETTRMPVEREGYGVAGEADLTAERLEGTPVYDATDDWVGEVSDLVIGDDGQVQAVVVDIGGFLGIGEKPVALELGQVDVLRGNDTDDLRIYVSMTEEEMEAMPDYESY